ncbi:PREDICTED: MORN repeat-containing protein 1, partial [Condylura cristata]|uniref:MORN repeat-containing protein 1 n=1 Tax=Condylura cristata TaxID=143302 RepID=UPI00064377D6
GSLPRLVDPGPLPRSPCPHVSSPGHGVYTYRNAFFRYEGEWRGGKKHGRGKLLLRDGSYYEGEFLRGEITGEGRRHWASSGDTYSGHFVLGEPEGHGIMTYGAGGRYEGSLSCGVREGQGCLVDRAGQEYRGSFHGNRRHGHGRVAFRPARPMLSPQGQWHGDVFSGQGRLDHCSGATYHGLWINGHPAARATRISILGPEVLDVAPGCPFTVHVQLQQDNGAVAECESGRLLQVAAGVQLPAHAELSSFSGDGEPQAEPLQTPFGFQCVACPLLSALAGRPAGARSAPEDDPDTAPCGGQGAPPCSPPGGDALGNRDRTAAQPWSSHAEGPSSRPALTAPPPAAGAQDDACCPEDCQRVERGCAQFKDVLLGPPPPGHHPVPFFCEKSGAGGPGRMKPAARDPPTGSRSSPAATAAPTAAAPAGQYVLVVREVTCPPFLGRRLPAAFKRLRVSAQGAPAAAPPQV